MENGVCLSVTVRLERLYRFPEEPTFLRILSSNRRRTAFGWAHPLAHGEGEKGEAGNGLGGGEGVRYNVL